MNEIKFRLLKEYLEKEKNFIPENIKTTKALLSYVKRNLTKEQYQYVVRKKEQLEQNVEEMFAKLKKDLLRRLTTNYKV